MKAPRSRQEATSGAWPLANAVASRAQRASWKEWRRSSGGAGRLAAARTAPRSAASALRASAATSIGSRSAASTTAQSSSRPPVVWGATTAGQASAARARSSAGSAAAGSSRAKTSTAASSPIPNGSRRRRSSEGSIRPPSAPASTSPARRRSVSRATRRRISSSATTATACWRMRRSKSPRPPESRTITTQACGGPPPGEITGWASARPATEGWAGTKGWPSPVWARASLRIAPIASAESWRRKPRPASRSPRPSRIATVPPTAEAIVATISSRPRSSSTSRSSRRWTAMPRCSTSYCSLTRRAKAFSVIAMNGVE